MEPDPQGERYEAALDDGTRLLFRPVRPEDSVLIQKGLERMSPQSRYLRFFRSVDHLTADELRYLTQVDFQDHFAWIAVLPDTPGVGAGIGRWIRLPSEPEVAEAAVTVADEMQHRGIGTALLWLLARSALARGIDAFRVAVLGENRAILELLGRLGAQRGKWEGGVVEFVVPLLAATEEPPARLVLRAVAAGLGSEDG